MGLGSMWPWRGEVGRTGLEADLREAQAFSVRTDDWSFIAVRSGGQIWGTPGVGVLGFDAPS